MSFHRACIGGLANLIRQRTKRALVGQLHSTSRFAVLSLAPACSAVPSCTLSIHGREKYEIKSDQPFQSDTVTARACSLTPLHPADIFSSLVPPPHVHDLAHRARVV
jgi:hypothetical protein